MSGPPEERGQCLATADAHGDDAEFEVAADEALGDAQRQDGARRADWVAQGDGAAVRVDLRRVQLGVAVPIGVRAPSTMTIVLSFMKRSFPLPSRRT